MAPRPGLAQKILGYARLVRFRTLPSSIVASVGGSTFLGNPLHHVDPATLAILYTGVLLAHASVDVFNEYSDYVSGLDARTPRTPLSGGVKAILDGIVSPRKALALGFLTMGLGVAAGAYLALSRGLLVIVFMAAGVATILLYTNYLTRYALGEVFVCLKSVFIVLGSSYVVYQQIPAGALLLGLAYGMVSFTILYTNHVPDIEADREVGRRTLPMILGNRLWAGHLGSVLLLHTAVLATAALGIAPPHVLILHTALVLQLRASQILRRSRELEDVVRALKINLAGGRVVDIGLTAILALRAFAQ